MATYEIVKVRLEQSDGHEHIADVEVKGVSGNFTLRRQTVVDDLRSVDGDRYYTLGGGAKATVVVRGCPYCTFKDYITTLPDSTTQNNLLSLPRFY